MSIGRSVMTRLYYHFFYERPPSIKFEHYLMVLPAAQRDKIRKYMRWQDAHASLFGKLLLLQALRDFDVRVELENLEYTVFGKPYIAKAAVGFNISHSGNCVICVMSTDVKTIGVDVEEIKPIDTESFRSIWTIKEWSRIQQGHLHIFYQYWTRKEAIVKAEGDGLNIPLNQIDVSEDVGRYMHKTYFLTPIHLAPQFSIHCASLSPIDHLDLRRFDDSLTFL
jgi:4'-phosphopantetheinyl transferase